MGVRFSPAPPSSAIALSQGDGGLRLGMFVRRSKKFGWADYGGRGPPPHKNQVFHTIKTSLVKRMLLIFGDGYLDSLHYDLFRWKNLHWMYE